MPLLLVGVVAFACVFLLMGIGVPIGFSMGVVGLVGLAYVVGISQGATMLGLTWVAQGSSYVLATVPLFILMGQFAFYSGIAQDFYAMTYKWVGRLPGGLAIATVAGCAAFGAVCGSSTATAATLSSISLTEMKRYKYDMGLATATLAFGGTLGILIPPSLNMIVYGFLTEQSIGQLFIAGIVPGILLSLLLCLQIYIQCRLNQKLGPPAPVFPMRERLTSMVGAIPILLLFLMVMGGMYLGWFTPTEGAAIGAVAAVVLVIALRKMNRKVLWSSMKDTGRLTAMIMGIVIGAVLFGQLIALTGIPSKMALFVEGLGANRYIMFALIAMIYLVLGCLMDVLAMLFITIPIIYPIIIKLGFDPIWFGIELVILCEIALVTPPVGMNIYVISGMAPDVPMQKIFRSIVPFLATSLLVLILLVAFPQIALWLPQQMFK